MNGGNLYLLLLLLVEACQKLFSILTFLKIFNKFDKSKNVFLK